MPQEYMILSPKNLYRALTTRKRKGENVFEAEGIKGVTLVRFWREMLAGVVTVEVLDGLFPLDSTHPRT